MSNTYYSGGDDFDVDLSQFELRRGPTSSSGYHERYSPPSTPPDDDFLPRSTTGKRNPLPSRWSPPPGKSAPSQRHKPVSNGRAPSPPVPVEDRLTQIMLAPRSPPRPKRAPASVYQPERRAPPYQYQSAPMGQRSNQYKSSPNLHQRSPSPSDPVSDHLTKLMLAPDRSPPYTRRKPLPPHRPSETTRRQFPPAPPPQHYKPVQQPKEHFPHEYQYNHSSTVQTTYLHEKKRTNSHVGMSQNYYQNNSNRHATSPNYASESRRDERTKAEHHHQQRSAPPSKKSQANIPKPPPRPPTPPQNPQPKPTHSPAKNAFYTLQPRQRPKSTIGIPSQPPPPPPPSSNKPHSHTTQRPKAHQTQSVSSKQRALTYHPQRQKREVVRPFLPFDPKAPSTPMPDYGDANCAYIPPPDY